MASSEPRGVSGSLFSSLELQLAKPKNASRLKSNTKVAQWDAQRNDFDITEVVTKVFYINLSIMHKK